MASKRRNMFQKKKTQETTENGWEEEDMEVTRGVKRFEFFVKDSPDCGDIELLAAHTDPRKSTMREAVPSTRKNPRKVQQRIQITLNKREMKNMRNLTAGAREDDKWSAERARTKLRPEAVEFTLAGHERVPAILSFSDRTEDGKTFIVTIPKGQEREMYIPYLLTGTPLIRSFQERYIPSLLLVTLKYIPDRLLGKGCESCATNFYPYDPKEGGEAGMVHSLSPNRTVFESLTGGEPPTGSRRVSLNPVSQLTNHSTGSKWRLSFGQDTLRRVADSCQRHNPEGPRRRSSPNYRKSSHLTEGG
ncbi:hypothetical protein AAG570_012161 [Ranatra chinensis]|uniref:Uncharacterized protein n=1 Tax=Ranatra chinensis TaxID=642074 RepID=A0ABD0YHZ5_9HEMI